VALSLLQRGAQLRNYLLKCCRASANILSYSAAVCNNTPPSPSPSVPPSPQMADAPEVVPPPIEAPKTSPEYKPQGQKYESEYISTQSVPRIPASESTLEVYSTTTPTTSGNWGHGEVERGVTQAPGPPSRPPNYEEERYGHNEERETEEWQVGFWQCCTPGGLCRLKPCTNTSRAIY
jgi:hypothetical protein